MAKDKQATADRGRTVHAPAHAQRPVPAGYVLALCGTVTPLGRARETGVNCPSCKQVRFTEAITGVRAGGGSRGAAQRAMDRLERLDRRAERRSRRSAGPEDAR